MFDNGHLRADTKTGQQLLDSLLSVMREGHVDNSLRPILVEIHDNVWQRVVKVCWIPHRSLTFGSNTNAEIPTMSVILNAAAFSTLH